MLFCCRHSLSRMYFLKTEAGRAVSCCGAAGAGAVAPLAGTCRVPVENQCSKGFGFLLCSISIWD